MYRYLFIRFSTFIQKNEMFFVNSSNYKTGVTKQVISWMRRSHHMLSEIQIHWKTMSKALDRRSIRYAHQGPNMKI